MFSMLIKLHKHDEIKNEGNWMRQQKYFGLSGIFLVMSLILAAIGTTGESIFGGNRHFLVTSVQAEEPTPATAVYPDLEALMSAMDADLAVFDQINYIGTDRETASMIVSFDAVNARTTVQFRLEEGRNIYTQADEALNAFDTAWEESAWWHDICYTTAPDTAGCDAYIAVNEGIAVIKDMDGHILLKTDFAEMNYYGTGDIEDLGPIMQYYVGTLDDFFWTEKDFVQFGENEEIEYLLELSYRPEKDIVAVWAQEGEATPDRTVPAPELAVKVYAQMDDEWKRKLYFEADMALYQMRDDNDGYQYYYSIQSYKGKPTVQFFEEKTPVQIKEYMEQVMDVGGIADYMMIVPMKGSDDFNPEHYYIINVVDGQIVSLGAVELDETVRETVRNYAAMLGKKELIFEHLIEEVELDTDGDPWSNKIEKAETETLSFDDDKQNPPADTNDPADRHASGDNVPNDAKPQGCGASVPVGTPDVFQIDRQGSKATIYFTPVRDNTDRYHVIFGNSEGDERYSGIAMQVSGEQNNGVLAIDVDNLDPTAQYSFKVAPVNDCAVGTWSNWLTAKGVSKYGQTKVKTYRYQ